VSFVSGFRPSVPRGVQVPPEARQVGHDLGRGLDAVGDQVSAFRSGPADPAAYS
jgi:hypothetical protein